MKKLLLLAILFGVTSKSYSVDSISTLQGASLLYNRLMSLLQIAIHGGSSHPDASIRELFNYNAITFQQELQKIEQRWGDVKNYRGDFATLSEYQLEVIVPYLNEVLQNFKNDLDSLKALYSDWIPQVRTLRLMNYNPTTARDLQETMSRIEYKNGLEKAYSDLILTMRWEFFIINNLVIYITFLTNQATEQQAAQGLMNLQQQFDQDLYVLEQQAAQGLMNLQQQFDQDLYVLEQQAAQGLIDLQQSNE